MDSSDLHLAHQFPSADSKIVASLERISQAFRVLLWQESITFSLSPIQVQILVFLRYHNSDKCRVSYLADEFDMTKATISDAVKTLEIKKLIQKLPDTRDTRSFTIQLTPKGRDIAARTSYFTKEIYKPISCMSREDKNNMLQNLLDIIRHLNKVGVITVQRMCTTCVYYQRGSENSRDFCRLLNQELSVADLRIDCPEHQPNE